MKMSFLRVLIVCALGAIASTTQAGISHVNDDTFEAVVLQANEVTRDSVTDLDWLDIDAYTNFSYTAVLGFIADPAHALSGWRHATRPEVELFYDHLSLPTANWPGRTEENADAGILAQAAAAYTGITGGVIGDESVFYAYGTTATQSHLGPVQAHHYEGLFGSTQPGASFSSYTDGTGTRSVGESRYFVGHWLVQTTPSGNIIPEPSTFSMLAFCGIAMAGYTRLRRRRK